jgi:hypothetical protein
MKNQQSIRMMALTTCLLATFAMAGPIAHLEKHSAPPLSPSSLDKCLTVWCQEPSSLFGIQSQISANPPEVVTQIADFVPATDEAITMMKWWGSVGQGPGPVDAFLITFFRSGGCTGPSGEAIYERSITSWSEVDLGEGTMEYTATFSAVPMDASENYWVSVQALMDIDPRGYWIWHSAELELCPAMAKAPSYGILDWTQVFPFIFPDVPELVERAFCLYTDGAVTTAAVTWGSIKACYR